MTSRLFLCLAVLLPLSALAQPATGERPVARVSSPDGSLEVAVTTDPEGRASYSVSRSGRAVIAPSRLGIMLTDAPKLERNLDLVEQRTRSHDETWEQPWGERRFVRDRHNELRVTFAERAGARRRFDVLFRAFDDGIGFRYDFPAQAELRQLNIADELTEFVLADPATAWWIPAQEWNRKEYVYQRTPLAEVGFAQTPFTLRTDDGLHLALHEAALIDYSAMNLMRVEGRRLRAMLFPGTGTAKVQRAAPFATPWRVLLVSDDAAGLAESDLVLNLNAPNALGDVSWVKPMKYLGIWWEMHLDTKSWGSGPKHGATTAEAIRYIDFAAEHGIGGLLVEGWNLGWDGDWFANGEEFSFTEAYPDFDIERVAAHAQAKGVRLIGHHETSGHAAHYEDQLEDALDLYERLGVAAIKTGYVADGGQAKVRDADGALRLAWHEGQAMSRHHVHVITEAAKRRISINPHEPIKDSGLRRTYPNWVTREGARGMEYNAWGEPGNPPGHEATLVFTRMLDGPFDFTPGVFSMQTRSGGRIATTLAKQLALYVVIYSPLQMAIDLPENYEADLPAFRFIEDVPVDWEDSRVLAGEIGEYVAIARRERGGDDWYLGAVTDDEPREVEVALSFLEPGRGYTAQVYRDGPDAGWRSEQSDIVIEQRTVTAADTLSLALASGGGQAIRFVAD
ncbi:glycoside hydrolase family 97 protein [Luteimonas sp. SJ-92]|uniref:Glycoside hydrolase family 97 protein n=1 Tax=Luteimonas salinisoli TaxID=2752307 RepID=A0A853J8T6_9GAMM|nr:glycoside hydrolase family 97 protein [Luteimonas salinisoli]NZA25275.1 glycoside hydrolase family 97 protein [Luteimonas salinisoli]